MIPERGRAFAFAIHERSVILRPICLTPGSPSGSPAVFMSGLLMVCFLWVVVVAEVAAEPGAEMSLAVGRYLVRRRVANKVFEGSVRIAQGRPLGLRVERRRLVVA